VSTVNQHRHEVARFGSRTVVDPHVALVLFRAECQRLEEERESGLWAARTLDDGVYDFLIVLLELFVTAILRIPDK
jgi:hypothetical protein